MANGAFTGGTPAGTPGQFSRRVASNAFGKNAAGFRSRTGLISVVASYDLQGLMRNPDGTLNFMQEDFAKAHRRLAEELSDITADEMQLGLKRPSVSSGRLLEALRDPQNRASDQFGFGVGNPRWLDKSRAKYWRQIDQGFKGHVGRVIVGVWGDSLTGAYRTPRSGGTPYPVAGPGFNGFADGEGQRLLPMGRSAAYKLLRKLHGSKDGNRLGTRGVIHNPIEPERYFKRGWEAFDAKNRVEAVAKEIISDAFGGHGVPTKGHVAFLAGRPGAKQLPPSKQFRK